MQVNEQQVVDWLDSAKMGWDADDVEQWLNRGRMLGPDVLKILHLLQDRKQTAFHTRGIKIALNRYVENSNAHYFPYYWEEYPIVRSLQELNKLSSSITSVRISPLAFPEDIPKIMDRLPLFKKLKSIWINVENQAKLACLKKASGLKSLIVEANGLKSFDIEMLGGLSQLEYLQIYADSYKSLEPLCELKKLKSLLILGSLKNINFLKNFGNLTYLRLKSLQQSDLAPIGSLTSLKALYLDSAVKLTHLDGLKTCLPEMIELGISDARLLNDISVLQNAIKLKKLKLHGLPNITTAECLSKLDALTDLRISKCSKLSDVGFIEKMDNLVHLELSSMPALQSLSIFKHLKGLKRLVLVGTKIKNKSYEPIFELTDLRTIDAWRLDNNKIAELRKMLPQLIFNGEEAYQVNAG